MSPEEILSIWAETLINDQIYQQKAELYQEKAQLYREKFVASQERGITLLEAYLKAMQQSELNDTNIVGEEEPAAGPVLPLVEEPAAAPVLPLVEEAAAAPVLPLVEVSAAAPVLPLVEVPAAAPVTAKPSRKRKQGSDIYNMSHIVLHYLNNENQYVFRVRWQGYSQKHDTFEFASCAEGTEAKAEFDSYMKAHGLV